MQIFTDGDDNMYKMSDTAKLNNERVIGLSLEKIKTLSFEEEKQWIESRRKDILVFSKKRKHGIAGRGNPLLARRKIRTMKDLDKKNKKYFGM